MTPRTPHSLESFAIPLPIPQAALHQAHRFARQQPMVEKAEQVRLNTLAVWVVNDYLQLMDIPTDLAGSDSWNPYVQLGADVADLELPGLGRLECRPVLAGAAVCAVPPEVWEDRLGYVVVQVDESQQEAELLGFALTAEEHLSLAQLRSPEDLLAHLAALQQVTGDLTGERSPIVPPPRPLVRLSQWLDGVFETGWQTVDSLLNPQESSLAWAFRSPVETPVPTVRRAKLISLGVQVGDRSVVLVVDMRPDPAASSAARTDIHLQVHPYNQSQLPAGLTLAVLDETGAVFLQAQARDLDGYLQLHFNGTVGETFAVQIAWGGTAVVEEFVI